jgi:hypothetical protein
METILKHSNSGPSNIQTDRTASFTIKIQIIHCWLLLALSISINLSAADSHESRIQILVMYSGAAISRFFVAVLFLFDHAISDNYQTEIEKISSIQPLSNTTISSRRGWPISFHVPHDVNATLNGAGPIALLFGAIGRHNFGDVIMAEITARLLISKCGYPDDALVYADLFGRDMRPFGGKNVISIVDAYNRQAKLDVIMVGGEILGATAYYATYMLIANAPNDNITHIQNIMNTSEWRPLVEKRCVYVANRRDFRNVGTVVLNTVGGLAARCGNDLNGSDFVSFRDFPQLNGSVVAPDSVVLLRRLFDGRIRAHHRFTRQPRPYLLVQFLHQANSVDELFVHQLAHTAVLQKLDVLFVAAGVAPGHDSLSEYKQTALRLRRCFKQDMQNNTSFTPSVTVIRDLRVWSICSLISRAALVLTTSLHVRLVAFVFGVPRLNLAPVKGKINHFMRSVDANLPTSLTKWTLQNMSATVTLALSPRGKALFGNMTAVDRAADQYLNTVFHPYSKLLSRKCTHVNETVNRKNASHRSSQLRV